MRIAIVNDMQLAVELLRRIVMSMPDCQVAWTASDGEEAVRKCAADTPDILIMDMMMPKMNGVEATRRIMMNSPCAILIVTASVNENSTMVFNALGAGALDAVNTPSMLVMNDTGNDSELVKKLLMLKKLIKVGMSPAAVDELKSASSTESHPLVAIGASTGGPQAVSNFFATIPEDVNAAFALVQHIDRKFIHGLAAWLGHSCRLPIRIAEPGDIPRKGTVLLAGTNDHMIMRPDRTIDYTVAPENNPYRPSVDVFFTSLARYWRGDGMAILLTGIGRDGAAGMLKLRQAGWRTFAQDQASCVVYGMPKAAAEIGAAEEIMSPAAIGRKIVDLIKK